ncbi:hypothetical protein BaRGS_00015502, partial [Batillaria attramentaria]
QSVVPRRRNYTTTGFIPVPRAREYWSGTSGLLAALHAHLIRTRSILFAGDTKAACAMITALTIWNLSLTSWEPGGRLIIITMPSPAITICPNSQVPGNMAIQDHPHPAPAPAPDLQLPPSPTSPTTIMPAAPVSTCVYRANQRQSTIHVGEGMAVPANQQCGTWKHPDRGTFT